MEHQSIHSVAGRASEPVRSANDDQVKKDLSFTSAGIFISRGTLETYVQTVRHRQQKEFAPIYVIILHILDKGMATTA